MKSRYNQKLVDELIALEWEIGCITVGSKLSWPKPLPRAMKPAAPRRAVKPAARRAVKA